MLNGLNCLINGVFPHFFSILIMIVVHLLLICLHLRIGCIVDLLGVWAVDLITSLESTNCLSLCRWRDTSFSYIKLLVIVFHINCFWRRRLLLLDKMLEVSLFKVSCFWRWRHQSTQFLSVGAVHVSFLLRWCAYTFLFHIWHLWAL
jgi:hypothetical protein